MAKKNKTRTNQTLFEETMGQLMALGMTFPCLDSFREAEDRIPITSSDYTCVGEMYRGTNEGLFIRLVLVGADEIPLGTLRSLSCTRNTRVYMAMMMADALWICEDLLSGAKKEGRA